MADDDFACENFSPQKWRKDMCKSCYQPLKLHQKKDSKSNSPVQSPVTVSPIVRKTSAPKSSPKVFQRFQVDKKPQVDRSLPAKERTSVTQLEGIQPGTVKWVHQIAPTLKTRDPPKLPGQASATPTPSPADSQNQPQASASPEQNEPEKAVPKQTTSPSSSKPSPPIPRRPAGYEIVAPPAKPKPPQLPKEKPKIGSKPSTKSSPPVSKPVPPPPVVDKAPSKTVKEKKSSVETVVDKHEESPFKEDLTPGANESNLSNIDSSPLQEVVNSIAPESPPAFELHDTPPAVELHDTPPAVELHDTPPAVELHDTPPAVELHDTPPAVELHDTPITASDSATEMTVSENDDQPSSVAAPSKTEEPVVQVPISQAATEGADAQEPISQAATEGADAQVPITQQAMEGTDAQVPAEGVSEKVETTTTVCEEVQEDKTQVKDDESQDHLEETGQDLQENDKVQEMVEEQLVCDETIQNLEAGIPETTESALSEPTAVEVQDDHQVQTESADPLPVESSSGDPLPVELSSEISLQVSENEVKAELTDTRLDRQDSEQPVTCLDGQDSETPDDRETAIASPEGVDGGGVSRLKIKKEKKLASEPVVGEDEVVKSKLQQDDKDEEIPNFEPVVEDTPTLSSAGPPPPLPPGSAPGAPPPPPPPPPPPVAPPTPQVSLKRPSSADRKSSLKAQGLAATAHEDAMSVIRGGVTLKSAPPPAERKASASSTHDFAMAAIRGGISLKSVPPPPQRDPGEEKVVDIASELRVKALKRKKQQVCVCVCVCVC